MLATQAPCRLVSLQCTPYHISCHRYISHIMSSNNSGDRRRRGGSGVGGNRGGYGPSRGSGNGERGHGRGRGGGRGRGDAPIIDSTSTPRGICRFYWSSGACDRSFDCTYKHEARVQAPSSATQSTDHTPDFFSLEGLAGNNGSVLDAQHTLSPIEAHNHLKLYLFDKFVFRDAIHVEGFSRILASVNSRNRAWVRKTVTTSNVD
jgi:hypothetical protein